MKVNPIVVEFDEKLSRQRGQFWFRLATRVIFIDYWNRAHIIPVGFTTDLASVPRILWSIVPPFGFHLRASIVHDWLYSNKATSRRVADAIFLDLMKHYGVKFWRRWVMYLAVRSFGWIVWRKK